MDGKLKWFALGCQGYERGARGGGLAWKNDHEATGWILLLHTDHSLGIKACHTGCRKNRDRGCRRNITTSIIKKKPGDVGSLGGAWGPGSRERIGEATTRREERNVVGCLGLLAACKYSVVCNSFVGRKARE